MPRGPRPQLEPAPPRPPVEVEILEMTAGGRGLGRLADGRVVFVPRALPGDRVLLRLTRSKRRYAEGEILQRLNDSPERVLPPCDIAHRCGGCPWMAWDYGAQAAGKAQIVTEALARIGGVPRERVLPLRPAAQPLGYRTRARLFAEGKTLGFRALGGRDLVDVVTCPILLPALDEALGRLRYALRAHVPLSAPLQIELMSQGDRVLVAISGAQAELFRHVDTGPDLDLHLFPEALPPSPPRRLPFTQANEEGNAAMRAAVTAALSPKPGVSVVDIYCGSGNFSLPLLAAGATVFGIELREDAIAAALAQAPPDAQATFVSGPAEEWLTRLDREGRRFDAAILNPPRTGAPEILQSLLDLAPRDIVYVSCDPATLARDLKVLQADYEVLSAQPFDLMPHTFHVETLAHLRRRGRAQA